MAFTTPITDRTYEDTQYAFLNQDSEEDLKGAWNVSDVNRVIDNTIWLRDTLVSLGYYVYPFADQPHMEVSDYPYYETVSKVYKQNVMWVVNAFYKQNNPSISTSDSTSYLVANALEQNILITWQLVQQLLGGVKRSGTFNSGQAVVFPC